MICPTLLLVGDQVLGPVVQMVEGRGGPQTRANGRGQRCSANFVTHRRYGCLKRTMLKGRNSKRLIRPPKWSPWIDVVYMVWRSLEFSPLKPPASNQPCCNSNT